VAHDPRAPRLAAVATLTAAALFVASAVNLQFNIVGTKGIGIEEGVTLALAAVAILIGKLANKEREIPELGQQRERSDIEDFGQTLTRTNTSSSTASVNPTTASIISGILGETMTAESQTVQSAISTLSTGDFAANVEAVLQAPAAANQNLAALEPGRSEEAKPNRANVRDANPTDETTGETLQRVLVKAVPLPGREHQPAVDPASIPGLEPNRVFVREGVASVPLPGPAPMNEVTIPHDDTNGGSPLAAGPEATEEGDDETTPSPTPLSFELPDLSGLWGDDEPTPSPTHEGPLFAPEASEVTVISSVPSLPNLEDLFDAPQPTLQPVMATPNLPDLDELF